MTPLQQHVLTVAEALGLLLGIGIGLVRLAVEMVLQGLSPARIVETVREAATMAADEWPEEMGWPWEGHEVVA